MRDTDMQWSGRAVDLGALQAWVMRRPTRKQRKALERARKAGVVRTVEEHHGQRQGEVAAGDERASALV